jgi:hypothetical protein
MTGKIHRFAPQNGKSAKLQKTGVDTCEGLAKFHIGGGQKSFAERQAAKSVHNSATKVPKS